MAESSNTQGQQMNQTLRRGRRLKPRSGVWNYFTRVKGRDGKEKAQCNRCGKKYATHGTTNQWKHLIKECGGQESADAGAPQPCAQSRPGGSSDCCEPDLEAASRHLARMIALHGYDASIVEDDCFRSFVRCLNPGFEVPSRVAIEEMCDGIFDEAREVSLSRLQHAPGRASVAVGRAKTIEEAGEAVYIACHFIDEQWNLHKFVLDAFLDSTEHYLEGEGPILGVEVFVEAVDDVMGVFSGHEDRLSMVAYDTTDKAIHPALKNGIDEINSDSNLSLTTTTYVDTVLHSIARCLLPDSDFTSNMFEDMERLHLTRQKRLQLLSELDLHYEWAYHERWCACYFSLQVLRKRGFIELADSFVELVCRVWEQVYRGIQRISASTSATSNLCLVELFNLREILRAELAQVSEHANTGDRRYEHFNEGYAADVLGEARDILDKAIQDWYLVWSVPLALDPRYKLEYIEFCFKRVFGSEAREYVTAVTKNINNLYDDYMKKYGTVTGTEHSQERDVMAAQVNNYCQATETELDCYLRDRRVPATDVSNLLNWWKDHTSKYPMVARMARDALAMPTCSKLSSDQLAQVRSILRGYFKKPYHKIYSLY